MSTLERRVMPLSRHAGFIVSHPLLSSSSSHSPSHGAPSLSPSGLALADSRPLHSNCRRRSRTRSRRRSQAPA
jgi:hypothetical protein